MFKMVVSKGYQCEFTDPVFDDFYCKKCTLVARRLTITICCGESSVMPTLPMASLVQHVERKDAT